MKGIILAGGSGTRLYPATIGVCKQILPIYDKPLIYYPLSVLMLAGIREILIISSPEDCSIIKKIFSDGQQIGIKLYYALQPKPRGIADAFLISEEFIAKEDVCLILGDNIFFGHGFVDILRQSVKDIENKDGAVIFGYHVKDPQNYGVIEFDGDYNVTSIEEKPEVPKSNYVQTGLYFYDSKVVEIAKGLKPSNRGEMEITDVNLEYLRLRQLNVKLLGRGIAWFDTGTHDSMLEASEFIEAIEKRQGQKIGCIEEVAFRLGYIDKNQLINLSKPLIKSGYGEYLIKVANEQF
jgi:glucose-1-phosphate thymidylyltransferase